MWLEIGVSSVGFVAIGVVCFGLGIRLERGVWERRERIRRATQERRAEHGTRLRRIRLRR